MTDSEENDETWREMVNDLKTTFEQKAQREQELFTKRSDLENKLDEVIIEEKTKSGEIRILRAELEKVKASQIIRSAFKSEDNRKPPSPLIKSSGGGLRGRERHQTPKNSKEVDMMLNEHQASFSHLKDRLKNIKSKII